VRPLDGTLPPDPVRGLLVLFDTSASRALGFRDQVARLSALVTSLRGPGGDLPLTVAAFDQTVEVMYSGSARGFGAAVEQKLRQRRALGASDLSKALAWAAGRTHGVSRLLLVTDGVATAGQLANGGLQTQVKALAGRGIERLDVLAVGGIRDEERLAALVAAGLARAGVVLPAAASPAEQARRLNLATRSGLAVTVEGAAWVWPQRLDGVQPGDEVLVYADLPAAQPLKLAIAGKPVAASGALAPAPRPLLERAWVKARLARLMSQRDAASTSDPDLAEALRKQVIDLSVRHRVLSPFTALLVLETENDYRRFGIERRALADILTVGPAGIEVLDRQGIPSIATSAGPALGMDVPAERALRPGAPADKAQANRASRDDDRLERRKFRQAESESKGEGAVRPMTSAAPGASAATSPAAPRPPAAAPPPRAGAPAPEPSAVAALESVATEEEDSVEGGGSGGRARPARRPAIAAKAARGSSAPPAISRRRDISDDPLGGLALEQPTRRRAPTADESAVRGQAPYDGRFAELMALLARGQKAEALARALTWYEGQPGDVLALVAIGEAAEASADATLAARAYGSIIDLFPGRADLRRFAGNRLERVRGADALALAIDSYRQAVEQRPDHPAGHRLLAFALVKAGRASEAFAALEAGLGRRYPDGRFAGVGQILAEDLGLVAQAWSRAEPARAGDIRQRLRRAGGREERQPSLRFVLSWETDANDVDFHIRDGRGGHAYYSQRTLASGGELYADVTTGCGPECFTVRAPAGGRAYPYKLQAHYYRRGPMGYGMGKLQIIAHDGRGGLQFEERPFVVMRDGAYVDLGSVATPKSVVVSSAARPGTVLSPLRR
jgi:tetratricopeptide (TPR) repeat protein